MMCKNIFWIFIFSVVFLNCPAFGNTINDLLARKLEEGTIVALSKVRPTARFISSKIITSNTINETPSSPAGTGGTAIIRSRVEVTWATVVFQAKRTSVIDVDVKYTQTNSNHRVVVEASCDKFRLITDDDPIPIIFSKENSLNGAERRFERMEFKL